MTPKNSEVDRLRLMEVPGELADQLASHRQLGPIGRVSAVWAANPGDRVYEPYAYLRHNLIHDLAALNKAEMLLWDSWGLMERDEPPAEGDVQRLDRVAEATASADLDLSELRRLYDGEPDLRVPAETATTRSAGRRARWHSRRSDAFFARLSTRRRSSERRPSRGL
jgi:hypothetical protein